MVALTLDLTVRTVANPSSETSEVVEIDARPRKVGRTTLFYEVEFRDPASGALTSVSHVTFVASPRPQDVMPPARPHARSTSALDQPFADALGARVLDAGVVEAELRPYVEQSTGSMQGGVIALLAEVAAESLAGAPVLDLDLRYLSSVRAGPARAVAHALDRVTSQVEIRDTGREDRLCALAVVRTGG